MHEEPNRHMKDQAESLLERMRASAPELFSELIDLVDGSCGSESLGPIVSEYFQTLEKVSPLVTEGTYSELTDWVNECGTAQQVCIILFGKGRELGSDIIRDLAVASVAKPS